MTRIQRGTWMTTGAVVAKAARLRRAGLKIVFTSGCFDLLHAGHVALLDRASRLGDYLVVGVHSNRSARTMKGAGRPIVPLAERIELLAGLRMVDCVVSFDAPTAARLIARLRPAVLVQGGKHRAGDTAGYHSIIAPGGKVVTLPLQRGLSTSRLIGHAVAWSNRRRPRRRRTKAKA